MVSLYVVDIFKVGGEETMAADDGRFMDLRHGGGQAGSAQEKFTAPGINGTELVLYFYIENVSDWNVPGSRSTFKTDFIMLLINLDLIGVNRIQVQAKLALYIQIIKRKGYVIAKTVSRKG